jgi:TPR repeat protein
MEAGIALAAPSMQGGYNVNITRPGSKPGNFPARRIHPFLCACAAAALLVWSAQAGAADPVPTAQQIYHLALEAQSARDYRGMARLLRSAAERGDGEAQVLLGMMLLQDRAAYGNAFRPDVCEARGWFHRAADQGNETGRVLATFLHRQYRLARNKACY